MTKLTAKEVEMLTAFIAEGADCMGAETAEHLKEDNMTWMNANDLADVLGWNKQEIGGVMSSLEDKGMICNSGETVNGIAGPTDWTATDAGIDHGWPLYAVEF